jgi:sphingosine kinase
MPKLPKRRILALLNPFGGRGMAPGKWQTALQILNLAHVTITLRPTERAMHAYDIAKDELISAEYDCVVTVSGDGLIHEVVNGVM